MSAPVSATVAGPAGHSKYARWIPIVFFLGALVLFYFANRAAYKGYFSDDDLDNIGWPTIVGSDTFVRGMTSPLLSENNFRPTGMLYYRWVGKAAGLHYRPYVAVLQLLHVLNVLLVYFLLKRLGFARFAAAAGALFYAFNAVVMEAYWKPMFVFDVVCCTMCLLALILYVRGHWLLALIPFWLAYKSKEIAIMLPFALLAYEFLLGGRRWKRLIPFFVISASFGLQAVWHNRAIPEINTYVLRFTPQLVWHCIAFYSSAIFFLPFAGFALLLLPLMVRDRRLYLGLVAMVALIAPMCALPSRLMAVYWYVPMIGLAMVVAAVATRVPRWAVVVFFVLWLPLNYVLLRDKRKEILALGDESHGYVRALQDYSHRLPPVKAFVYDGLPEHMHSWGVEGAIRKVFGWNKDVAFYQNPDAKPLMAEVPMAVIGYYPVPRVVKGYVRTRDGSVSELHFDDKVPESQVGAGWYENYGTLDFRWASPKAEVTLYRPAGAKQFEIDCFVPPEHLLKAPTKVSVLEDGKPLGTQTLSQPGEQHLRWDLPDAAAGDRQITVVSEPALHGAGDTRDYGVAVRRMGYAEQGGLK